MADQAQAGLRLRRLSLTVQPESTFPVPVSDGYSVYSALLSVLGDVDEDVSAHVHDSPLGSLHNSGLQGNFGGSDRSHHKTVRVGKEYEIALGVADPNDAEIFQALVSALVLDGNSFKLTDGTLRVESFESSNTTHQEIVECAADLDSPHLGIDFRTATCIQEAPEIFTMFPHRGAVFRSLCSKWNQTAPEELTFDLSWDDIISNVIEKPEIRTIRTHSRLVHRTTRENGEPHNQFMQGFTGKCAYAFKDASEAIENAVTTLALFAEYSGVGGAVARGCGNVMTEISD